MFNHNPLLHTPEFSRLGQHPATIEFGPRWPSLSLHTPLSSRGMGQMANGAIMHARDGRGNGPAWGPEAGEWIWGWAGDRRARATPSDGPCRAKLHSPPLSQGRGCLQIKRKKKVAELFPQHRRRGGTRGRRLDGDSRPVRIWRLGLARDVRGREEWAWGRGAARPVRGMGSRGERVNFKSGA